MPPRRFYVFIVPALMVIALISAPHLPWIAPSRHNGTYAIALDSALQALVVAAAVTITLGASSLRSRILVSAVAFIASCLIASRQFDTSWDTWSRFDMLGLQRPIRYMLNSLLVMSLSLGIIRRTTGIFLSSTEASRSLPSQRLQFSIKDMILATVISSILFGLATEGNSELHVGDTTAGFLTVSTMPLLFIASLLAKRAIVSVMAALLFRVFVLALSIFLLLLDPNDIPFQELLFRWLPINLQLEMYYSLWYLGLGLLARLSGYRIYFTEKTEPVAQAKAV